MFMSCQLDQSPKITSAIIGENLWELKFLLHTGAEMLAKKYDMNVIFLERKIKVFMKPVLKCFLKM